MATPLKSSERAHPRTSQHQGVRLHIVQLCCQRSLRFEPMVMMGIDFLEAINPPCAQTSAKYVLIAIDFFSRFIWAMPCVEADSPAVIEASRST